MFMVKSFVVRFHFIFMMFWVCFEIRDGGSLGPILTVGPNIRLGFE